MMARQVSRQYVQTKTSPEPCREASRQGSSQRAMPLKAQELRCGGVASDIVDVAQRASGNVPIGAPSGDSNGNPARLRRAPGEQVNQPEHEGCCSARSPNGTPAKGSNSLPRHVRQWAGLERDRRQRSCCSVRRMNSALNVGSSGQTFRSLSSKGGRGSPLSRRWSMRESPSSDGISSARTTPSQVRHHARITLALS